MAPNGVALVHNCFCKECVHISAGMVWYDCTYVFIVYTCVCTTAITRSQPRKILAVYDSTAGYRQRLEPSRVLETGHIRYERLWNIRSNTLLRAHVLTTEVGSATATGAVHAPPVQRPGMRKRFRSLRASYDTLNQVRAYKAGAWETADVRTSREANCGAGFI